LTTSRQDPKRGTLERGAIAEVWRNTLSQVPTLFGRLVYLAGLIDPNSGRYQHHGLAHYVGEDDADAALRQSHEDCFTTWIAYPLVRQRTDLEEYLSGIEGDRKVVLRAWLQLERYRECVPASALQVEKELFLGDLETLLALLRNQFGVSLPD
jgi:hypothetical protein